MFGYQILKNCSSPYVLLIQESLQIVSDLPPFNTVGFPFGPTSIRILWSPPAETWVERIISDTVITISMQHCPWHDALHLGLSRLEPCRTC